MLDVTAYLQRIGYQGSLIPNAQTLRDLQLAHLRSVPFENLSIHAGEAIVLDDASLFEKIVIRRRGGFCYEANGLFACLLRELAFRVSMLSAEVANPAGEFSRPFDHMALMVQLEQRWLVDVGFGDSFLEPLLIDERGEQPQANGVYRIVPAGAQLVLMHLDEQREWKPQYRFSLEPHKFADYQEMCVYHQTSPDSHFTKNRLCSIATATGRVTLSGMRLISTAGDGSRSERTILSDEEFAAILRDQFGVVMTT
ncbi:MAG TPA: arylamine N-acetyltransferase [Pyrinomonadaceae bacterium]|nr:arylamine N-acetyltransferase [Pyrinomonadaceae bacterium]